MATVGVIGEALVDLLPASGDDPTLLRGVPGGSPANVAVALARLGVETRFLGRTSTDRWGALLRQHLTDEGVAVGGQVGPEPTALAVVEVAADGAPSYRFLWEGTADRRLGVTDVMMDLDGLDALHVGSVSCVLEPAASAIEQVVLAIDERLVVSFDPNVRPSRVDDHAAGRARLLEIADHAHVVRASDEDLAFLFPDHDVERAAWELLDGAQTQLVVVTEGARGARVFTPRFEVPVPPDGPDEVVDAVGAGDTFTAALLAGLADHGALDVRSLKGLDAETARAVGTFAARAAGVTVGREGADPPHRDQLYDDSSA